MLDDPGTLCDGEVQGTAAEKRAMCQSCEVFGINNTIEDDD